MDIKHVRRIKSVLALSLENDMIPFGQSFVRPSTIEAEYRNNEYCSY